jgi:hypothetical protein
LDANERVRRGAAVLKEECRPPTNGGELLAELVGVGFGGVALGGGGGQGGLGPVGPRSW